MEVVLTLKPQPIAQPKTCAASRRRPRFGQQGFDAHGMEMLRDLGFKYIQCDALERDGVVKRYQGQLVMVIDNSQPGGLRVSWEYLRGSVMPTYCDMTDRLWNAILDGFDNSTLLDRFSE